MRFERAVPVLQVADVGRSIEWYVAAFGFAILRRDSIEMMLQHGEPSQPRDPKNEGWAVYLRIAGDGLLDPDGYRVCVSGSVPADANVPSARECDETAP